MNPRSTHYFFRALLWFVFFTYSAVQTFATNLPYNDRGFNESLLLPISGHGEDFAYFDGQQQNDDRQKTAASFNENLKKCSDSEGTLQQKTARVPNERLSKLRTAKANPNTEANGFKTATKLPLEVDHDRMIAAINEKLSYLRQQPLTVATAAKITQLEDALSKVLEEKECK